MSNNKPTATDTLIEVVNFAAAYGAEHTEMYNCNPTRFYSELSDEIETVFSHHVKSN